MAQFRVEFVLDEASGRYIAELYHPERENEVIVRTAALYPTHEAALLGVVQLFKDVVPQVSPAKRKKPARKKKAARRAAKRSPRKAAKRRR